MQKYEKNASINKDKRKKVQFQDATLNQYQTSSPKR